MKIGFFGCSFTEGCGLDNAIWNEYAIKHNLIPKEFKGQYETVKKLYRFSTLVGKELNCEVENFAEGGNSNETILNNLFEYYNNLDISVVQFTFFHRVKIYDDNTNNFYEVNSNRSNAPKNVIDYGIKTITEYQNIDYEKYKIKQMVNLYDKLFEKSNKQIIWMFVEKLPENLNSKNMIYFKPSGYIGSFVHKNKLTLKHETKGYYDDLHYSLEGNRIMADKILEKINER